MLDYIHTKVVRLSGLIEIAMSGDGLLSTFQFVMLATCRQLHPITFTQYYNLMFQHQPGLLLLIYTFELIIFWIPMYTILLFLGAYSKMKMFRVWNCLPLLKNIDCLIGFTHVVNILLNQQKAAYFIRIFTFSYGETNTSILDGSPIWKSCNFFEADEICLPMTKTDFDCKPSKEYELSLVQFIRKVVFKRNLLYGFEPLVSIDKSLLVIQLYLWTFNAIALSVGMRKLAKFLAVCISSFIIVIILKCIVVILRAEHVPKSSSTYYHLLMIQSPQSVVELSHWMKSIVFISGSLEVGSTVWLGAIKPAKLKPLQAAFVIFGLKLFTVACYVLTMKNTAALFVHHNWHIFTSCKTYVDQLGILAMLLNSLLLWKKPAVVITFGGVIGLLMVDNIISSHAFCDSIVDELPVLVKWRFPTMLLINVVGFLLSIVLSMPFTPTIFYSWIEFGSVNFGIFIFLLITIMMNNIYTNAAMAIDYSFCYGQTPPPILGRVWSCMPIIALFITAAWMYWLTFVEVEKNDYILKLVWLLIMLALSLPMVLGLILKVCKLVTLSEDPNRMWGPHDAEVKLKRLDYNPDRALACRLSTVSCQHRCLVKVAEFTEERKKQRTKYEHWDNRPSLIPLVPYNIKSVVFKDMVFDESEQSFQALALE